jgi:hypothetical protein
MKQITIMILLVLGATIGWADTNIMDTTTNGVAETNIVVTTTNKVDETSVVVSVATTFSKSSTEDISTFVGPMALVQATEPAATEVSSLGDGQDATNCWLTIQPVVINGTNGVEVVAYYPTNWTSRAFQISTDLTNSNNWSGVSSSDQVVPLVKSPPGVLPKWSKYIMKSDGAIGGQFFRMLKQ